MLSVLTSCARIVPITVEAIGLVAVGV